MKNPFRSSLLLAGLAIAAPVFASAPAHPGSFELGNFTAADGCEFVEINLRAGLIKFASKIAAAQEPEVADLLRNLESIRVNVVGMDESNRAATLARITAIRSELEKLGWEKIVTVQKAGGGDDVAIYLKSRGEDAIAGLVVTVIEKNGKAVFVNVVGDIRAEQLALLGEKFEVKALRQIKVKPEAGA